MGRIVKDALKKSPLIIYKPTNVFGDNMVIVETRNRIQYNTIVKNGFGIKHTRARVPVDVRRFADSDGFRRNVWKTRNPSVVDECVIINIVLTWFPFRATRSVITWAGVIVHAHDARV